MSPSFSRQTANRSIPEPSNQDGGWTIDFVLLRYWRFAESYYQRDREPTRELACMRDALKLLRQLYGGLTANDFGPLKLKALRDHMIDVQDLCRNEVNKRIGRIKRFFRWAVSEELVLPSVVHGLDAVKGLRKNKSRARETERVKPVPDEQVAATLPFLSPQLVAMINLQRLTGICPGEVVLVRAIDIDMTSQPGVWVYFPDRHKKDWLDEPRAVALGPMCQLILQPFLNRADAVYCFSPEESYYWQFDHRKPSASDKRKTPIYPSEVRARQIAKQSRRKKRKRKFREEVPLGACGYKSQPVDGRVEIAYETAPGHEGKGVATALATELVQIARGKDVSLTVFSQSLPEENASTSILKNLGFQMARTSIIPRTGWLGSGSFRLKSHWTDRERRDVP